MFIWDLGSLTSANVYRLLGLVVEYALKWEVVGLRKRGECVGNSLLRWRTV